MSCASVEGNIFPHKYSVKFSAFLFVLSVITTMSKRRRLPNNVLCESEASASSRRRVSDQKSKNSKTTQGNLLDCLEGDIKMYDKLAPLFLLRNYKDNLGKSFLHSVVHRGIEGGYSCIKNSLEFILREAPETLSYKDNNGNTALMLACMEPVCPELIIRLAEANPSSLHQINNKDEFPLWAFLKAKLDEISLETCCKLLERLCELGGSGKDNRSIVYSLGQLLSRQDLSLEHINILAEILLRHGAKIIADNNYYALREFHKITFNLMESIVKYCPDDITKESQNCSVIKSIFVQYASHGFTDQDNSAVKDDLLKALKIVIQKPLPNPIGSKLIIEAVNRNLGFEVIKVLVTQTQEFSFSNVTPGLFNKFATSVELVSELEELGYDFNVKGDDDLYPLHVAAVAENEGAVIKLLELGANPLLVPENCVEEDMFWDYITLNESVLKVVLNALKNPTDKNILLSSFYLRLLLELFFKFNDSTSEKLYMVKESLNHNKIDIKGTLEYKDSYGEHEKITVNVVSYIIYKSDYLEYGLFDELYQFVKLLEVHGFKVSDAPEDSFSALTTLLLLSHEENDIWYINSYVLPMVDLLLEYGVDVQSNTTSLQEYLNNDWSDYVEECRQDLCIPDALFLSMWYIKSIELVQRLLVHWWGPPVALTAMLPFNVSSETDQYYKTQLVPFLVKFGHLPYGSSLISEDNWIWIKLWEGWKEIDADTTRVIELKQPLSLQDLCKYEVRKRLSITHATSHRDISLPDLLDQVLPYDLPPSIHNKLQVKEVNI